MSKPLHAKFIRENWALLFKYWVHLVRIVCAQSEKCHNTRLFSPGVVVLSKVDGHTHQRWCHTDLFSPSRYEICPNFTLPDFHAKTFTPPMPPNFNRFSDKNTKVKMEKFTPLAKLLHYRRQWQEGQIWPMSSSNRRLFLVIHKKHRLNVDDDSVISENCIDVWTFVRL